MGRTWIVEIVTVVALLFIFKMYYDGKNAEFTSVESMVDGKAYIVRNMPDKEEAANNIARVREKLVKLVQHLTKKYPNDARIKRLNKNFRDDVLCEAPSNSEHTSYSINKGQRIYFCLRQRNNNDELVDVNTLTFVALHELSHVMSVCIGHKDKEFWDNFKFLIENAIDIGIYEYQPFHKTPVSYCGTMISDTPYKQE